MSSIKVKHVLNTSPFTILALRPLEDAERDRKLPIVLHKLPVVAHKSPSSPRPPTPILNEFNKLPQNRTSHIVRNDLPIIAQSTNTMRHINRARPPSRSLISSIERTVRGLRNSGSMMGNDQYASNNPDILELHRSGILPNTWNVHTDGQRGGGIIHR